jgi:hypothetical protein
MSSTYVNIKNGVYRGQSIKNIVFPLIKQYSKYGDKDAFITVNGAHMFGDEKTSIRVKLNNITDYEFSDVEAFIAQGVIPSDDTTETSKVATETDEQIMERIGNRFDILHEMTRATCEGSIRAMIVTGAAGIGKSYGVEKELERASLFDKIAGRRIRSEVIKGAMTPIGLYQKLYQFSDKDNVLVFDDADGLFYDDLSLNLLKAALDTSKTRKICWNSESSALRRDGIPETFNFKGSIIFITNIKFENIRSKTLKDHLTALESRCHYLDLTLDTTREKLLRIRQIANSGELFTDYNFDQSQQDEIIDFLFANQPKLRETSLRTAIKVADLYKSFPHKWKEYSDALVMRNV